MTDMRVPWWAPYFFFEMAVGGFTAALAIAALQSGRTAFGVGLIGATACALLLAFSIWHVETSTKETK